MLQPKAFYFLYYAAMASLLPFLVLYYEHVGLNARQIGYLSAMYPLCTLVAAPLWASLADARQNHKQILLLSFSSTILIALFFTQATQFIALMLLVALFAVLLAPVMPIFDNMVLQLLATSKDRYGRLRFWGAIGWGLSAPLAGVLSQRYNLSWAFYTYSVLSIIAVLSIVTLPAHNNVTDLTVHRKFWQGLHLFRTRRWIVFLFAALIGGVCMAISSNFVYLYLSELNASPTLVGLSLTVATISEMPIWFLSNKLLGRYKPRYLVIAALLLFAVRFFLYALVSSALLVLLIQLMHGVTFVVLWTAGVSYADKIAPAGLGATAQSLFASMLMGLGSAAGAYLGGNLYEGFGATGMFYVVAISILVLTGFLIIADKTTPE